MQLAFARFESQQLTVSRFDYIVRQNWNVIFLKKQQHNLIKMNKIFGFDEHETLIFLRLWCMCETRVKLGFSLTIDERNVMEHFIYWDYFLFNFLGRKGGRKRNWLSFSLNLQTAANDIHHHYSRYKSNVQTIWWIEYKMGGTYLVYKYIESLHEHIHQKCIHVVDNR